LGKDQGVTFANCQCHTRAHKEVEGVRCWCSHVCVLLCDLFTWGVTGAMNIGGVGRQTPGPGLGTTAQAREAAYVFIISTECAVRRCYGLDDLKRPQTPKSRSGCTVARRPSVWAHAQGLSIAHHSFTKYIHTDIHTRTHHRAWAWAWPYLGPWARARVRSRCEAACGRLPRPWQASHWSRP
jgi:hypothetical protein